MASGRPGPRGDLSSVTAPNHFPSKWTDLEKQTLAQKLIWQGVATGDQYTDPIEIGLCEGFSIYVHGTGDWNVQVSPNPNNPTSFWVDVAAADKSGDGFYSTTSYHPWVRVVVKDGANLLVWIFRKYSTY